MKEVAFINYKGVNILRVEFPCKAEKEVLLMIIKETSRVIAEQPEKSVLTLTVFGDFHFDTDIAKSFGELVKHDKPFVKAGAVVGIGGLKKAVYNSIMIISHRSMKICADEEEGKEFLLKNS